MVWFSCHMVQLRSEPVQSRARETLDRILGATEEILAEVGPDQATTRMIAERAGVSVGSLYRFFPDKVAIVRELVSRYVDQMGKVPSESLPDLSKVTIDDIETLVRIMVNRSIALHEQHPAWRRTRQWRYPDTGELASAPVRKAEIAMISLILQLVPAGLAGPKADLIATTVSLTLWPLFERALAEPESRDALTEEAIFLTTAYVTSRLREGFANETANAQ